MRRRPELEQVFLAVIAEHTAGDPQGGVRWTYLRPREIAQRITAAGIPVSRRIVRQLLKHHGFVRRQAQKKKTFQQHPDRPAQFERITELKQQYLTAGWPVISIDTKKKELLGNFYRNGKLYTRQTIAVLDHDFPSYGHGKIIPHGIYDLGLNKAHVHLGASHDTTEFACDSIAHWWSTVGRHDHPHATQLLVLCDGGGSNPAGSALFQQDLQTLANRTGLTLRVAHYPSYCSKYNPIEHRVFPHLTRACEGVVFENVALVKQLMERARTRSGLCVIVDILDRVYVTGRKAAEQVTATLNLVKDALLPKWNYTISPHASP